MAKKGNKGRFKPYNSPSHVHDHPAHNLTDPSGGMMAGVPPTGSPMPSGGPTAMAPGDSADGLPPGY